MAGTEAIVRAVLDRHGRTYAEEIGFDGSRNEPEELFRLLTASLLFSARIRADIAVRAARALGEQGWTTADRLLESSWEQRARVLNESGYARYDERTASMLAETSELVRDRWEGDLRRLRDEADRDPAAERRLLKECKGIGDAGVDIYFREAQGAWGELYPFVDKRARAGAEALGLPVEPEALAEASPDGPANFARLTAALVRVDHAGDADELREAAV